MSFSALSKDDFGKYNRISSLFDGTLCPVVGIHYLFGAIRVVCLADALLGR